MNAKNAGYRSIDSLSITNTHVREGIDNLDIYLSVKGVKMHVHIGESNNWNPNDEMQELLDNLHKLLVEESALAVLEFLQAAIALMQNGAGNESPDRSYSLVFSREEPA